MVKKNCSKNCAAKKAASLPEEKFRQIEARLKLQSRDNRISCAAARAIAAELGVSGREVGSLADQLDIRINQCQLGCF